ncbi:hypothetical protein [Haloarcula japonica]|uniref:hypothetical protein n=1 Tax=Haloarcula japonica TaxID=29282 RepID=UPI0012685143|nr:hypothetical protein [Haloarcula japonica]
MSDNTIFQARPQRRVPTTKPNYQIVTSTKRVSVSKGGTAKFSVYFTGYGEIERFKMTAFVDYDSLLSDSGGTISVPLHVDEDDNISYGAPALEENNHFVHNIEANVSTMYPSEFIFFDSPAFESPPGENAEDRVYPTIISEGDWGDHAPLEIELDISEEAESGNYDFQFIFLYSGTLDSFQESSTVEIHVKSVVEEYEPWPQRFAILGALVALASLLYQTGIFSILSYSMDFYLQLPL